MERLLQLGVIPIINENDTVATNELESRERFHSAPVFGDNDKLSALVASGMDADTLLILSDVDGLFTGNPHQDSEAKLISVVPALTKAIEACADGQSVRGRGGMASKLSAVRVATRAGARVIIANGAADGILDRVLSGEEVGTLFEAGKRLRSRKRWIAHASQLSGRIRVNQGAQEALLGGRASLLSAGVVALEGDFEIDAVVAIADEQGRDFARGVITLDRAATEQALRHKSTAGSRALISRDTLVLLEEA